MKLKSNIQRKKNNNSKILIIVYNEKKNKTFIGIRQVVKLIVFQVVMIQKEMYKGN